MSKNFFDALKASTSNARILAVDRRAN